MNVIRAVIIVLVSLQACAISNGVPQNTTEEEVVVDMFDAFNRHDTIALSKFFHQKAVAMSPESCAPMEGREAITEHYRQMFEQIPDVTDTVREILVDGEIAAVTFTASSNIQGSEFVLPIVAVLTFEDGLIIRSEAYYDAEVTPDCKS